MKNKAASHQSAMKYHRLLLLVLGTLGLAFTSFAEAEILLDQQNLLDGSIGGQGIGCFSDISGAPDPECDQFFFQDAQGFTVGIEGQLARIKVPVRFVNTQPTADVTLELFPQKPDGSPDETQSLGSISLPVTAFAGVAISDPGTWPTFDVSGLAIQVAVGDKLAYVVRTRDTEAYLYHPEFGNEDFLYAGGAGLRRNAAVSQTWNDFGLDFGFQIYVLLTIDRADRMYISGFE